MYHPDHNAPPFNPVPPAVVALAAVIAAVELAFQAGARGLIGGPEAVGWRVHAMEEFAFSGQLWDYMLVTGDWRAEFLWRMVSYTLIHASLSHALFAAVLLLALGNFVSRLFHPLSMLLVMAGASVTGALVFAEVSDGRALLIGAYPAIYGLLGLYTWSLWVKAEEMGQSRLTAFRLVGVLVAIQVVFVLIGGYWESLWAEVAAFVAGFALATPAAPGGLARLRGRLQGH